MYKRTSIIVLLISRLNSVFGLYFYIAETEKQCFIEKVPDEISVIINYKVELYDPRPNDSLPSSPNIGVRVEVRDSDDKLVFSHAYSSEGRISFTSHTFGEHSICMYSNHTYGAQLRVYLDIQVGEHAIDDAKVAQKEQLFKLLLRIRQLLDQANQITEEQNYQRYREEQFRHTCETINSRVLWWSLVQTIVIVVTGYLYKTKVGSSPVNTELDNTRSINVLRETWKKMHYPTETGTIMLILRLMALYEHSNNKQEFLETLQSFQGVTVTTDQTTSLLGEHFERQREELFEAFCNAFNTEECALFTSLDAFMSLMALLEANYQGISISPLVDWMKMLYDLPLDEKAKKEHDEYMDNIEINVVNLMFL